MVKGNLFLISQNSSGFDSNIVLIKLPQWLTVLNLIKIGAGVAS